MKANTYFENLQTSISNFYAENHDDIYPMSEGQELAYHAWRRSENEDLDELTLFDVLRETEAGDFIKTLKDAKVKTFLVVEDSTSLMNKIHLLIGEGCKLEGTASFSKKRLDGKVANAQALRFSVK